MNNYLLLGRLQQDVEYFLGYGNRNERVLYYGNKEKHISEMISLWKGLSPKPQWLRAVDLINYKKDIQHGA